MAGKYIPPDARLMDYVLRHHSFASDELLADLRAETEALGDDAIMQVSEEQGAFLGLLAALSQATAAIEIGTFTGYSSICIARSLRAGGKLLCCDVNAEWASVAQRYWARAGLSDRIELRLGDAHHSLDAIPPEPRFDLAFVDADKAGYDHYYEALLPRMRSGGLLIFDNMLARGRVLEPESDEDRSLASLNTKLAQDERVECVLLTVADGLMLCRKR